MPFYLQTWEEHHLGEMFLLPINGPTEGLLIGMGVCLTSYLYGPQIWQQVCICCEASIQVWFIIILYVYYSFIRSKPYLISKYAEFVVPLNMEC